MWGGCSLIVWGGKWNDEKNNNQKYIVAFCSLQAMFFNATTNQKQAATTEMTIEGRRDEREARGSEISISSFFRGRSLTRCKKLK